MLGLLERAMSRSQHLLSKGSLQMDSDVKGEILESQSQRKILAFIDRWSEYVESSFKCLCLVLESTKAQLPSEVHFNIHCVLLFAFCFVNMQREVYPVS